MAEVERLDALRAECARSMDARLRTVATAPLVVGVSGGSDSLALLVLTANWARRHGRPVLALTVDHGLQAESAAWSRFVAQTAARLGATHRTLAWTGEKPRAGLSAAARRARHRLLAEAAREAGAGVVLMGHTADDRLEADWMRERGSTLGELRPWAPSPAWPEGRGVFLLRPLLNVRRRDLRDWLRGRDLAWIDDPANESPRSLRAQARTALAGSPDPSSAADADRSPLLDAATVTADGRITLAREALLAAEDQRRFTAAALACASGTTGPVRGPSLDALLSRMKTDRAGTASLGGAKVTWSGDTVSFARNIGDAHRAGLTPLPLGSRPSLWDGRFEIGPGDAAAAVVPLQGHAARLSFPHRKVLSTLPADARAALPAVIDEEGAVTCPLLDPAPSVTVTALARLRLSGALGGVVSEA